MDGVKFLINQYVCEINLPSDENDNTPLLIAISVDNRNKMKKEIIDFMIEKGADTTIKNKDGLSPYNIDKIIYPKKIEGEKCNYIWQNTNDFSKYEDF